MIVKCPVCEAEYECAPGKYQCECGAKFCVAEDGGTSTSKPVAETVNGARTVRVDADRTIPPRNTHNDTSKVNGSFDPDKTLPNIRIRGERSALQVGDVVLDRYELLEKLGSGAMGVVFKCRDQVSMVEYAVKMVPPELARDADAMEEVLANFQLVHGLKHPNIAGVDFLERDQHGAYFLIMEYVHGESLAQWIRRRWKSERPEVDEVADIVRQIASALDYAHSQQILHRDVKPANVMVDADGNVKVLDFGLASKVRSTMTAMSVNPAHSSGTPNYLSPEQFKGKYPSPASDQYALGVLAYQMLAGHLPFQSDDLDILRSIVSAEAPGAIENIPNAANMALLKALSKDPLERFASCTEFADALVSGRGTRLSPLMTAGSGFVSKQKKKPRRRFVWLWAVIGIAIAMSAAWVTASIVRSASGASGSGTISERGPERRAEDPAERPASRRRAPENLAEAIENILIERLGTIILGVLGIVVLFIVGQVVIAYFAHGVVR